MGEKPMKKIIFRILALGIFISAFLWVEFPFEEVLGLDSQSFISDAIRRLLITLLGLLTIFLAAWFWIFSDIKK